jgi:SSS family solute:Na+ symporter
MIGRDNAAAKSSPFSDADRSTAIATLRTALKEQSAFVKVHAAEALLALSYRGDVAVEFRKEFIAHRGTPQYRTGVFRVLARHAERTSALCNSFVDRLRDIYLDPASPDRVHALEALAKLEYIVPENDRVRFSTAMPNEPDAEVCLAWLLAVPGKPNDVQKLASLLESPETRTRGLAAYALRHLAEKLPSNVVDRIAEMAAREAAGEAKVHLLAAAVVTAPTTEQARRFKQELIAHVTNGTPQEKYQIMLALAERGAAEDIDLARQMLTDADPDVRIGAATALLRIDRRRPSAFHTLDWLVLVGYAVAMLLIGWYFSREGVNSEEFMLAGRSMKPVPVGISYFATLFSTITCLSLPGEVVRHGPMVIGAVLLYPIVFVIVGYFLIPAIMRLQVATAYEILEQRFGLSVRMLGSGIFLALRLAWMSMILFGMSQVVLVPLLGLSEAAIPWVALTIAVITVAYTALGGLKAVIWSDVAQESLMTVGIVLSIIVISIKLGGPSAWFPGTWASHWEPPRVWFDPTARLTFAAAALSQFTWYICTAGADQMAVQRYLSTKDAPTARRMFAISLSCDTFVACLLVLLGLALLRFYQVQPEMLPDPDTVVSGADRLFPQFIVAGLPVGMSGLIIAGLASAAMSSLSSGVSSTSQVVTLDWVNRFRRTQLSERAKVRVARSTSCLIGLLIVVLSYVALGVEGNLLDKAYRFINLFTAPLFVLFFMAMFVPRATTFSAWVAGLMSGAAALSIAYTDVTGLSIFWIMPTALVTGITAGGIATLLPIGQRRPMLARGPVARRESVG